jgi:hypothetical protein
MSAADGSTALTPPGMDFAFYRPVTAGSLAGGVRARLGLRSQKRVATM